MAHYGDNKELLINQGIKNTKQRNFILNILSEMDAPITAEDIFLKLKNIDASISLSTVYRILEVFVEKGIVLKSNIIGNNKYVFELNNLEHKHHLICLKCKRIVDIQDCPLTIFEEQVKQKTNFEITGHNLEIFGYCPDCQKK